MLASRLLSILMLLQARGRVSAADLAREFEVSVRTIHRDIDQLSAAGIPVYAERGRAGGFALLDGYRTKLTGLTQPEAESLFLAGLPGPAAQLGLAGVLSAARLKLMAALPPTVRPGAERIAERFHLDPVSWFRGADPLPQLKTVADAVWNERWLALNYCNSGALYPRKLGPLGLVLKGGVWYLAAQSGKSIRTYRIAQMQDVSVTDAPFPRPKKFDLAQHWEKSSRDYERGLFREEAEVRLSPKGMALLEQLGPYVEGVARKTAGKPDARGRVRCRLPIESLETGAREILRLRGEVEVLGPAALRKEIKAQLAALSKHHH